MKKMWCIYAVEYYSAIKKNGIMPLANTDGPRDKHTKGSMWAITYMWTLKHDTNELTYETETDSQRTDLWWPNGQGKDALEI